MSKVSKAILAISGALFAIGTCIAFVPSPWLPLTLAGTVLAVGLLALKVFSEKNKSLMLFPSEVIEKNNVGAPKVGQELRADVIVSNDVKETYEWKKELIRSAKKSVECSFNFAGGKEFRDIIHLISNKMINSNDFKAHLILSPDFLEDEDRELLEMLKEHFPNRFYHLVTERQTVHKPNPHTEENHVKLLVVDEKYFVVGGSGVQPRMVNNDPSVEASGNENMMVRNTIDHSFKDSDVIGKRRGKDNIAKSMRAQFFNLYQVWAYRMGYLLRDGEGEIFSVKGKGKSSRFDTSKEQIKKAKMRFIVCAPELKRNPIDKTLAKVIREANDEVRIANLHYVPSAEIRTALWQSKAKKKVGYFNGNTSLPHYSFVAQNRMFYRDFDTVHEMQTKGQCYHKKVLTIDGKISFCGSYNLGRKSHQYDYEAGLLFNSEEVTTRFNQGLAIDSIIAKTHKTNKRSQETLAGNVLVKVLAPHL